MIHIVEAKISSSADDAEENLGNGSVSLTSDDLELGFTGAKAQMMALRFNGIDIPAGAIITNAYLKFETNDPTGGGSLVTFRGEAAGNASNFTTAARNLSSRALTETSIDWAAPAWTSMGEAGAAQRSPDLSAIIQEIINRGDWAALNSLALFVTGTGEREARSYDGNPSGAPKLHIEYTIDNATPTASNGAGSVNEDMPLNGVLPAAVDPDGHSFSYSLANQTSHGTVTVNPNGTYTYSPAENYNGPDSFDFKVTDQFGASNTYSVDLTVSPVNDAPKGANATVSTQKDAAASGTLPVATDAEGEAFSYALAQQATKGIATVDVNGAYSYIPNPGYTGADSFTYSVTDIHGATNTYSVQVNVQGANPPTPPPPSNEAKTIEVSVASSQDDAEENLGNGSVSLTSDDLEFGYSGAKAQMTAMRFNGIDIPEGAIITSAYIQFSANSPSSGGSSITFHGEAASNAAQFSASLKNLSSRSQTEASVTWSTPSWTAAGQAGQNQRSPDLSAIIQEIIDQQGWAALNSLAILVTGTGERESVSYDSKSGAVPKLHVEYVLNQDPVVSVTARANAVEPDADGSFLVSISKVSATDTVISYNVSGTAAAGTDYQVLSGTVTIPAGQLSVAIPVRPIDDLRVEGNESVSITLNSVVSGAAEILINSQPATVMIADNDTPTTASVSAPVQATEGVEDGKFTVSLSKVSSTDTVLSYTIGGTANGGTDYQTLSGTITIAAGQLSADIPLEVLDDFDVEGNETVSIQLNSLVSGAENIVLNTNPSVFTIVDDDVPLTLSVASLRSFAIESPNSAGVSGEGDAAEPDEDGLFVVRLNKPSTTDTVIEYEISGTATPDADYVAIFGTVVIPAGQLSANISVEVIDDLDYEGDETVIVKLKESVAAGDPSIVVDTSPATVTISDNDQPTISVFETRISKGVDDAEEALATGSVSLVSGDLELGFTGAKAQVVGLRFNEINIPHGAIITSAYIQFKTDEATSGATLLQIRGEDVDNAAQFLASSRNISSRSLTDAVINWAPSAWSSAGEAGSAQQSADLSSIIQEIIDRAGWQAMNSIAFAISGNGMRTAQSFDTNSAWAPSLHIEYIFDNDAPISANGAAIIDEDAKLNGALPTAIDPDDHSFSYSLSTQANHGTVAVNANGTFSYNPLGNYHGADSFSFQVTDQYGAYNTYTYNVTIDSINDVPVAANAKFTIEPNESLSGVLPVAVDPDGDAFNYGLGSQASNGQAVVNPDGTYSYTPNADFFGVDSFSYTVTDIHGGESEHVVTVDVFSEFSFWVIADTPNSSNANVMLPQMLHAAPDEVKFVFHLGDIKPGTNTSPSADAFEAAADMFLQSPVPVFVVVGDNDSHDTTNPTLSLNNWRSIFVGFDQNWDHGIEVNYQSGSSENFSFVYAQTLFLSINYGDDNIDWLEDNFTEYSDDVTSAVVMGHAFANEYGSFNSAFIEVAQEFAQPILYLHGHKHLWDMDNPYSQAPNVTRVIVTQTALKAGDGYDPLMVTVSDDTDDQLTFDHDFV
jgi:hypothetical protein